MGNAEDLRTYQAPIDFHLLVGRNSGGHEKVAGSEAWVERQLRGINRAYDGLLEFQLGQVAELRGELAETYYRDADSWEAVQALSKAYGRPDRINVFVAKKFSDGGFGHANAIFAPLQTTGAAPSLVVRTGILSTFGVLMAHEIGHLVGLEHTASRACYGGIKVFEGCGRKIEYPCFEFDGFWDFSNPADVGELFAYPDWH
ncbi:MAG: reprolysin-like metallopeptidase, partial [Bdellovibrionota bacterium]